MNKVVLVQVVETVDITIDLVEEMSLTMGKEEIIQYLLCRAFVVKLHPTEALKALLKFGFTEKELTTYSKSFLKYVMSLSHEDEAKMVADIKRDL